MDQLFVTTIKVMFTSFIDSLPWYITQMNVLFLFAFLLVSIFFFAYRTNQLIGEATVYYRHKNRLLFSESLRR
jgi:hypothetical protein